MSGLLEPFQFEFFRNGLVAALLVGGLCGLIGVYVVLRGMSYIINQTTRRYRIGADAAIGIVTTASFAIGVALISRVRAFTTNFEAALSGNVLGVTTNDVWVIVAVTALTAIAVFFFYKQLLFTTFDRDVARVYGVRVEWVDALLSLILASAIIARLLSDSFSHMLMVSVAVGTIAAGVGMYLSYLIDVASGATIVLVAAGMFLATLAYNRFRRRESLAALAPSRAAGEVLE